MWSYLCRFPIQPCLARHPTEGLRQARPSCRPPVVAPGLDRHDLVSLRDQFLETRMIATLDMRHSFSLEIHSPWRFTVCFMEAPGECRYRLSPYPILIIPICEVAYKAREVLRRVLPCLLSRRFGRLWRRHLVVR